MDFQPGHWENLLSRGLWLQAKDDFRRVVEANDWYEAAQALIYACDFHGYIADELDTWLANGDVAYILSKTPQELADAYCDWIRLAQYTTDEGAP